MNSANFDAPGFQKFLDNLKKEVNTKRDNAGLSSDNQDMGTVTKDLLDARLETIEARMDARMVRIEGMVSNIGKSQDEVLASNKSMRTTIVVTGISSVLAIVGGIAAFNATVLSNMVASFESGKNTAASQAAAEKSITEATKALEAATEKAKQSSVRP